MIPRCGRFVQQPWMGVKWSDAGDSNRACKGSAALCPDRPRRRTEASTQVDARLQAPEPKFKVI